MYDKPQGLLLLLYQELTVVQLPVYHFATCDTTNYGR